MECILLKGKVWCRLAGMSLVELLATVGIIGILLVAAIPSFRGLQAREAMTLTQQGVSALLIRMQQLSLAPPETIGSEKVVGYGLAFHKKTTPNLLAGCTVTSNNDFFALYKFIVSQDATTAGRIVPVLAPFSASNPCGNGPQIKAEEYKKDFFILPDPVVMNTNLSSQLSLPNTPFPWLLSVPLQSAGAYAQINPNAYNYNNPLPTDNAAAKGVLVIQHNRVQVNGRPLCRSIQFSRSSSGIAATTQVISGC